MRAPNVVVITEFVKMQSDNLQNHSGSLYIQGSKLMNYATCIGQFKDGRLYINTAKYSSTTSRIQNKLKQIAEENLRKDCIHYFDNIEIGQKEIVK